MKKVHKVFLFAVGLLAITLEEISKAIDEASESLDKQRPKFIDRLSDQMHKS
jgi:hypothetical protein